MMRGEAVSYQRLVCWGDSQSVGARTYGCYPMHLVQKLEQSTRYRWSVVTLATNGHTARDLWFRVNREAPGIADCYQACLLIGANDVTNGTPVDLFESYVGQVITTLQICGWRVVHCGEIPPVWADGHAFADSGAEARRELYNRAIERAVERSPIARLVRFDALTTDCFVDPLHFSEQGNRAVADAFADSVKSF